MNRLFPIKALVLAACLLFSINVVAQEAYTCYTPDNTTLTFYYDNLRNTREGTTYDIREYQGRPDWFNDGTYSYVTRVVFNSSFAGARPTSTLYWFAEMEALESLEGMEYLNTSNVTTMNCMFQYCSSLTSLDVSSFNTQNVTSMGSMFSWCNGLTSIDVSNFNTEKVTNMSNMFSWCSGLTSLDLSSFNTQNVTRMYGMFYGCSNLATIYAGSEWSTAAVTSSSSMFYGCTNLVGGQGTAYSDSNPKDKTYAHIDGGESNPGYFTAAPSSYMPGDVNGDNNVSIADVTALIDMLLSGETTPVADVNGDSRVSIADVTALIDFLINGTW